MDLRRVPDVADVVESVCRTLGVRCAQDSILRKRRSIGFATDRTTWVRIERRPLSRLDGQGWGTEAAASLTGVAMPRWRASTSWCGVDGAMWHADECDLVPAAPVKAGGRLLHDPQLPDGWWTTLNASLASLGAHSTTRMATPDTAMVSQELVSATIARAFPELGDTSVASWHVGHADLNWSNVTGPPCVILDWEDWGLAPSGLDAATLWVDSLAVPILAARVWAERRADLESDDGRLMLAFNLAKVVAGSGPDDPLYGPARHAASTILNRR